MKTKKEILEKEVERIEEDLILADVELNYWQNKTAIKESGAMNNLASVTSRIENLNKWLSFVKEKLTQEK